MSSFLDNTKLPIKVLYPQSDTYVGKTTYLFFCLHVLVFFVFLFFFCCFFFVVFFCLFVFCATNLVLK